MRRKPHFYSINQKSLGFSAMLALFMVLFCLFFWAGTRYQQRQQARLLDVQHQYSAITQGLHLADSRLYSYAQTQNADTASACQTLLAETVAAAEQLSALLDQPIFVDLCYLVTAYAETADGLLQTIGANTGELLSLYETAAFQLSIIDSLMDHYAAAVDQDRIVRQQALEDAQQLMDRIIFIGSALMILLTIVVLRLFSLHITRSLSRLTARAEQICQGDWNVDMPQQKDVTDEIGVLNKAFDRMLREIRDQMELLRQKEALARQLKEAEVQAANMRTRLEHAQLKTLQSRVNPHFLFNALNIIGGQAADEQAEKTLDMILKTADYLRYSLDMLDKTVQLQDELRNVEDYFIIQQRRFGERIRFDVTWEDDCACALVPAMILQPLCENALIHGVSPMIQGGEIAVHACVDNGRITVTVTDNGEGFSPERLAEVRARLTREDYDDTEGIGFYSVMLRLSAFFSGNASCEIDSKPGVRTTVALAFPLYLTDPKSAQKGAFAP